MIELGYTQVQVWLDKRELAALALLGARKGRRGIYMRKLLCDAAKIKFVRR